MQTKLALLLALARGAESMIDEPSEGLDPLATERMLQAIVQAAASFWKVRSNASNKTTAA